MGFDPNKGGNGDTGNSGTINEWGDMRNFSYTKNGKVVYKDGAYIEPREDFGDGDDFTSVDLDNSANTSGRDYGKLLRDAMAANNVNDSPDRPIQIADSGVRVQDVSKNYNNYNAYVAPILDNAIIGGGSNPGDRIKIIDESSNLEPDDGAPVGEGGNKIQNGNPGKSIENVGDSSNLEPDDDPDDLYRKIYSIIKNRRTVNDNANRFNPGDPDIVREYEEDTGNAEKRGRVARIIEKARKSGIGKAFVRATIGVLLLGSLVGIGAKSGLLNKKAVQNATAIEQKAPGPQDGETDGSALATAEIDGLLGNQSETEKSAENLDTKVDITFADGEVLKGVNCEFGGDNTGADLLDNKNIESTHADPLTNKLAKWVDNEGNVFEAAQANPEAKAAFELEVIGENNRRIGNIAPLVQEGYALGYFGEGDNINNPNMTQSGYEFSTDSNEYQSKKELIQADYNKRMSEKTFKIGLLRKGQHYASIASKRIVNPDGTARPGFYSDNDVDASINGTMYLEEFDAASGMNYYDAHPEVKERVLRILDLVKTGASEDQIQDAMDSWTIIRLPGCMQYGAIKKTPEPTYTVEYKTPEKSSSTSTYTITPVFPEKPDPKLDDGSGIHKEEDDGSGTHKDEDDSGKKKIRRIYRGGNHHDDSSGIHESDKKDDDETPGKTPDKPSETPDKPSETPNKPSETPDKPSETPDKPSETPKDNEKVLEAKTDNVVGGNEFNSQKEGTATDQNATPLAGEATNNSMMESSGNQLSDGEVANQSVIGEFTENNASVSKEESEHKDISTSVTNENHATNSSDAPADSFERQTVADEVVNESNGETSSQNSYDTSAAEANYDFYSAF